MCWDDKYYIYPEKVYFEKRQSLPHFKYYLDMVFVEALETRWQFFATQHVDEETLARIERNIQVAREAAAAMKSYLSNLCRKLDLLLEKEPKYLHVMGTQSTQMIFKSFNECKHKMYTIERVAAVIEET